MGVVHLLVGPESGGGRAVKASEVVQKVIRAAGHTVEDITGPTVEDSLEMAQEAVVAGAERLIVVGGDGTLNLALQALANSDTILGIVPAGTGDDFAEAFDLSESSIEQATTTALGPYRLVDAIRMKQNKPAHEPDQGGEMVWVASSVTGGFSVDVNSRAEKMRNILGKSRFVIATLLTVPRLRYSRLTFTVDDKQYDFATTFWAVANTPTFGGGMAISPTADPCDGLLDLVVIADVSRTLLIRMLPTVFKGTHIHHSKAHTFRGRRITIERSEAEEDVYYQVNGDGEPVGHLPTTISVVRDAVRLAGA